MNTQSPDYEEEYFFSSSKLFMKMDLLPSPNVSAVTCCSCFSEPPTGAQSPHGASRAWLLSVSSFFPVSAGWRTHIPMQSRSFKSQGQNIPL